MADRILEATGARTVAERRSASEFFEAVTDDLIKKKTREKGERKKSEMPLSAGSKKRAQQRHGATRAAGYDRWHVAARQRTSKVELEGRQRVRANRKKERRTVVEGNDEP